MTGPEPEPGAAPPAPVLPNEQRALLAAHLAELERVATAGDAPAPAELTAMIARLRDLVAALDALIGSVDGHGAPRTE